MPASANALTVATITRLGRAHQAHAQHTLLAAPVRVPRACQRRRRLGALAERRAVAQASCGPAVGARRVLRVCTTKFVVTVTEIRVSASASAAQFRPTRALPGVPLRPGARVSGGTSGQASPRPAAPAARRWPALGSRCCGTLDAPRRPLARRPAGPLGLGRSLKAIVGCL